MKKSYRILDNGGYAFKAAVEDALGDGSARLVVRARVTMTRSDGRSRFTRPR